MFRQAILTEPNLAQPQQQYEAESPLPQYTTSERVAIMQKEGKDDPFMED